MQFDLEEMNKGLYIGGVWRAAEDGSVFDVLDPATEETIARVSDATVGDAIAAVDAAYGAAKGWASTPPRERSEMLRRAFELMVEEKDALAWLITLESGKALSEARGRCCMPPNSYAGFPRRRCGSSEKYLWPQAVTTASSFSGSRSGFLYSSRLGISPPRWRRGKSLLHLPRAAPRC